MLAHQEFVKFKFGASIWRILAQKKKKKKIDPSQKKDYFFRISPSFIQAYGENSSNACAILKKTRCKEISDLSQGFNKYLPQASTFFHTVNFFYECTK